MRGERLFTLLSIGVLTITACSNQEQPQYGDVMDYLTNHPTPVLTPGSTPSFSFNDPQPPMDAMLTITAPDGPLQNTVPVSSGVNCLIPGMGALGLTGMAVKVVRNRIDK